MPHFQKDSFFSVKVLAGKILVQVHGWSFVLSAWGQRNPAGPLAICGISIVCPAFSLVTIPKCCCQNSRHCKQFRMLGVEKQSAVFANYRYMILNWHTHKSLRSIKLFAALNNHSLAAAMHSLVSQKLGYTMHGAALASDSVGAACVT